MARKKAIEITELLGAKLVRVLRIAEPRESYNSPMSNSVYSGPRQVEAEEALGTFAPGAIEIRVSIEVAFEIE